MTFWLDIPPAAVGGFTIGLMLGCIIQAIIFIAADIRGDDK